MEWDSSLEFYALNHTQVLCTHPSQWYQHFGKSQHSDNGEPWNLFKSYWVGVDHKFSGFLHWITMGIIRLHSPIVPFFRRWPTAMMNTGGDIRCIFRHVLGRTMHLKHSNIGLMHSLHWAAGMTAERWKAEGVVAQTLRWQISLVIPQGCTTLATPQRIWGQRVSGGDAIVNLKTLKHLPDAGYPYQVTFQTSHSVPNRSSQQDTSRWKLLFFWECTHNHISHLMVGCVKTRELKYHPKFVFLKYISNPEGTLELKMRTQKICCSWFSNTQVTPARTHSNIHECLKFRFCHGARRIQQRSAQRAEGRELGTWSYSLSAMNGRTLQMRLWSTDTKIKLSYWKVINQLQCLKLMHSGWMGTPNRWCKRKFSPMWHMNVLTSFQSFLATVLQDKADNICQLCFLIWKSAHSPFKRGSSRTDATAAHHWLHLTYHSASFPSYPSAMGQWYNNCQVW